VSTETSRNDRASIRPPRSTTTSDDAADRTHAPQQIFNAVQTFAVIVVFAVWLGAAIYWLRLLAIKLHGLRRDR
jgi:hypothetical protein